MLSMTLRAILSILTILYTFLVMGSCAVPAPREEPVGLYQSGIPQGPSVVTLNILQCRPEISQPLQQAADRYMDQREGISIRVRTVENQSSYQATLRGGLLSGEQIDLFHIFGYQEVLELEEYLEDLSGLSWAGEAIPLVLEPVCIEEAQYGIPYSLEAVGWIADPAIFQAAQLSWGEIASRKDTEEMFRDLREQMALGELEEDFPMLERVTQLPALDYAFLGQLAEVALGEEFSSPQQAAEAPLILMEREAAMGRYLDMMARYSTMGKSWTGLLEVSRRGQVEDGLAAGRVAVIQQTTGIYTMVRQVDSELADRLRLYPIYLGEGEEDEPKDGWIYLSAPAYWAVNRQASEESKALAQDFLSWLYQSEEGAEIVAQAFGAVSAYRETAADTGAALHRQMLRYIEEGRCLPRYQPEFPADWLYRSFAEGIKDYLSIRECSWEEVCQRMREDWMALRKVSTDF